MNRNLLLSCLVLGILPGLALADSILTFPGWNGTDTISAFGNPNTSTYGEAITTPAGDGSVSSFSFYLQESAGFQFQAFISPWDNSGYALTGSLLFLSSVITATDSNLDLYSIVVPGAAVTPGTIYMFGITIDNVYAADTGLTGVMGGDLEADGNSTYYFAWSNDGGDFSLAYSDWNNTGCADNGGACGQAAFGVTYGAAVPEPGTLLFGATGLIGLGLVRLRKARR